MFAPGHVLNNRYEIKSKMQESNDLYDYYQAVDRNHGCDVIIKALNNAYSGDIIASEFRNTARKAGTLNGRNILKVSDWGHSDDTYYMVLENIKGISLFKYIEKKPQINSKEALSILISACYGMEEAHTEHIIHGELTSENILINTEGVVKITGFCIPRSLKNDRMKYYNAPEVTAKTPGDERSDIYSLGIILYEMLTKHVPFDGDSAGDIINKHKTMPIPSVRLEIRTVPAYVEDVIFKCCEKDPDKRYQSVNELVKDMKGVLLKLAADEKDSNTVKTEMSKRTDPVVRVDHKATAGNNAVVNTKPSEDYTRIRSVIKRAIELMTAELLLDKKLLINVIEDLAPDLESERTFLKKTYSDDVGRLLYDAYKSGSGSDYSGIDMYLLNEGGFNDGWRQRFFGFFSFMFPGQNASVSADAGDNNAVKSPANNPAKTASGTAVTSKKSPTVSQTTPKTKPRKKSVGNLWDTSDDDLEFEFLNISEPQKKSQGNTDDDIEFEFLNTIDETGSSGNVRNVNPPQKTTGNAVTGNAGDLMFAAETEKALRAAVLNGNNHFYRISGKLPKEVEKLLKIKDNLLNKKRGIADRIIGTSYELPHKIEEKDIRFTLTYENTFGVQEGIVVTEDVLTHINKSKVKQIPL
nr:serine/threonine protein kinase [Lachnospiraceae bacterium]